MMCMVVLLFLMGTITGSYAEQTPVDYDFSAAGLKPQTDKIVHRHGFGGDFNDTFGRARAH